MPAEPTPPHPVPPPAEKRLNIGRWLGFLACTALAAGLYSVYVGLVQVPERFNPWAALNVMAPPDSLTPYKLMRARSEPALCLAALAQTGMQYDLLPDRETGAGCGFENAVRLRTAPLKFGAPLTLSCPMALSFFMWDRHALQPAAEARFGRPVVAIDHLGSYACRNINRGEGAAPGKPQTSAGNRSRHATANALDVAGFTLADGKHITVLRQWNVDDDDAPATPEALLLRDAHDGACRYFKGVLGPDYNAVHRDHFHLETGGYGMCR